MFRVFTLFLVLLMASLSAQESLPPQDESFDPAILKEPTLPILDKTLIYEIITDLSPTMSPSGGEDSLQIVAKSGWKVQLFSTSDFFLADSIYQQAQQRFPDQAVEKVFDLPYYKIRVGNCQTREEAEKLLAKALELRYFDAWVIRTRIKVVERGSYY